VNEFLSKGSFTAALLRGEGERCGSGSSCIPRPPSWRDGDREEIGSLRHKLHDEPRTSRASIQDVDFLSRHITGDRGLRLQ